MPTVMPTSAQATMPEAPRSLEATGLLPDLVHQLVLKMLHAGGEMTGTELAGRLGVLFSVIQPSLDLLKRDRYTEMYGGGTGPHSNVYRLTDLGRSRAAVHMSHSAYVGRLPVPLSQYRDYMRRVGSGGGTPITRDSVREAFASLVIGDHVLDQIGPGVTARHSLFIYGPPGNGKTAIANTLVKLLGGDIAIPFALAIEGEIISVYDPLNHQALNLPSASGLLARDAVDDGRWIACRRPIVGAGSELTLDAFELGYSQATGLYRAPLQTLANGGVLLIDDFGRQRVAPRDLLNRWIVPLESRIDYLVLQTGQKFELPLEAMVVFTTNMNPIELLDESFLRRIRYKIYTESPTQEEFTQIFEQYCACRGVAFDRELVETLITCELQPRFIQLRGCQPRDLIEHALSLATYLGAPKVLTRELLSSACGTYFLSDDARYAH